MARGYGNRYWQKYHDREPRVVPGFLCQGYKRVVGTPRKGEMVDLACSRRDLERP